MAMTARELVFFVRAENQASRVFSRVARDLRGLKTASAEANAAQRAGATRLGSLQNQAKTVALQREQITTGSKALNLANRTSAARTMELQKLEKMKASLRDVQKFQERLNNLNTKYAQVQSKLIGVPSNRMGLKQYAAVRTELEGIQAQISAVVAEGNGLAAEADKSRIAYAKAANSVNVLTAAEREAAQKAAILLERIQAINAAVAEQDALVKRMAFEQAAQNSINKVNVLTQTVSHLGYALRLVGIIGVASMIAIAHHAAGFQSATTLAATQARPNNAPVSTTLAISARLNKVILDQMQQFPASSKEMADSLYQIFSSTDSTIPQAIDLLKTFNKSAVAGGASLKDMTEAGISIRNNFPKEFKNMDDAMQTFFASVRYGRMNATQFANSLAYILPIAKEVHSNFKNVANDMAFFTRQTGGRLTRQDAQGYARLIQLLGRTDVTAGLAKHGVAVFDKTTGAMRPLVKIMADINKAFKGQGPQDILNFFKNISAEGSGKGGTQGTIQAIRIFAQARTNLKAYQDVIRSVSTDNKEFTRSYAAMNQTPGVRWAILTNQLKAFATVLGEQAIPALEAVGKPLYQMFQWFNNLSDSWKRFIARGLVFGSAFALIGGQLLMFGAALARMILTMRILRGLSSGAGGKGLLEGLGLTALKTEAGEVNIALLAVLTIIPLAAGAIFHFHINVLHAITGVKGFLGVLKLLSIVLSSLLIRTVILQLVRLIPLLAAAAAETGIFATAIIGLQAASVAEIAIIGALGYGLSRLINKLPHVTKLWTGLGHAIYNATHSTGSISWQNKILKGEGLTPNAGLPKNQMEFAREQYQNLLAFGLDPIAADTFLRGILKKRFKKDSKGMIAAVAYIAEQTDVGAPHDLPAGQAPKTSMRKAKDTVAQLAKSPSWAALYTQARDARKMLSQAPTQANWKSWLDARNALLAASTKTQGEAAIQVLDQIKVKNVQVSKISDSALMREARNVEKLKKIADRTKSLQDYKKYEAALRQIQGQGNLDQQAAIQDWLSAQDSANTKAVNKAKNAAKSVVKNAQKEVTQAAQTLQGQYSSMFQANQSAFGQVFNGPFMQGPRMQTEMEWGHKVTGHDLLTDIRSQVSQFKQWRGVLRQLKKKGIPNDLYNQILAAGPSALPQIRALLSLDKKDLTSYFNTFSRGEKLIEGATKADLTNSLAMYRQYGRNIALAIIQGLKTEHTPMLSWFEATILKMFPGLAKAAKGKGAQVTKGKDHEKIPKAKPATVTHTTPKTSISPKPVRTTSSAAPGHVTYEINTHPVDVSTGLRKAKNFHSAKYGRGD